MTVKKILINKKACNLNLISLKKQTLKKIQLTILNSLNFYLF